MGRCRAPISSHSNFIVPGMLMMISARPLRLIHSLDRRWSTRTSEQWYSTGRRSCQGHSVRGLRWLLHEPSRLDRRRGGIYQRPISFPLFGGRSATGLQVAGGIQAMWHDRGAEVTLHEVFSFRCRCAHYLVLPWNAAGLWFKYLDASRGDMASIHAGLRHVRLR